MAAPLSLNQLTRYAHVQGRAPLIAHPTGRSRLNLRQPGDTTCDRLATLLATRLGSKRGNLR